MFMLMITFFMVIGTDRRIGDHARRIFSLQAPPFRGEPLPAAGCRCAPGCCTGAGQSSDYEIVNTLSMQMVSIRNRASDNDGIRNISGQFQTVTVTSAIGKYLKILFNLNIFLYTARI